MDELAALIFESLAKDARTAKAQAAAKGPPSAAKTAAPAKPPPRPPAPAPRPPRPAPPAAQAESDLAVLAIPALFADFAPAPAPAVLLGAFSGPNNLLAGIVFSEVLAPPVSLRRPDR